MKVDWVPLRDVMSERQEVPDPAALVAGDIPIVSKISFAKGKFELRTETETNTNMILIRPGDLVVSGINANKGAIAIHRDADVGPIAATIHYSAYECRSSAIRPEYLWWLLRSKLFLRLLAEQVPGGIKSELKAKRLLPVRVPLPDIAEQDRLIEELQRFRQQSDVLAQWVMSRASISRSVVQAAIDHVFTAFPEDQPFENVISFRPRSGPSFPTDPEWSGTPVIMPSALSRFGVDLSRVEFGPGNEDYSDKDILMPGDLLIARGNKPDQVGTAGVVPESARGWVCANLLMRCRVDTAKTDPEFCVYWLRSSRMRRVVKEKMKGTTPSIQKINQKSILAFPFPVNVEVATQRKIVEDLRAVEDQVAKAAARGLESKVRVDELWDSLADSLLVGQDGSEASKLEVRGIHAS